MYNHGASVRFRPALLLRWLAIAFTYTGLLAFATFPQIRHFSTAIADDVDPRFSIWRLAWIAHQLVHDPAHLFDANIFYPERHTLAYSDAMLAAGAATAPFFWLHVNPVLVYNVCLFGGFVLSGLAMYLFVEDLTKNRGAALAAGALFTCAPFRFEHYLHLELQLTFAMPLALWALHRLVHTAGWRPAVALGATIALQTLCSVYYGIFLGTFVAVVAGVLLVLQPVAPLGRRVLRLAAAGALAAALVAGYLPSYLAARDTVGGRSTDEVLYYSATPADYLSARSDNLTYGTVATEPGGEERHLFPGVLILVAAVLSLLRPSRVAFVYLIAAAFAFDASLGLHGHVFPWLRAWLLPYQGLRVPARFAMLVVLALSVLAGLGVANLSDRLSRRARVVMIAAILLLGAVEARTTLPLATPPLEAGPVDRWLAAQPRSPVLELPLPPPEQPFQLVEGQHLYDSIFHWQPLLNGISGFWPKSYFELLQKMRTFPDSDSLGYLSTRRVRYLVVRERYFTRDQYVALRDALTARPDLTVAARFLNRREESVVFELRR